MKISTANFYFADLDGPAIVSFEYAGGKLVRAKVNFGGKERIVPHTKHWPKACITHCLQIIERHTKRPKPKPPMEQARKAAERRRNAKSNGLRVYR